MRDDRACCAGEMRNAVHIPEDEGPMCRVAPLRLPENCDGKPPEDENQLQSVSTRHSGKASNKENNNRDILAHSLDNTMKPSCRRQNPMSLPVYPSSSLTSTVSHYPQSTHSKPEEHQPSKPTPAEAAAGGAKRYSSVPKVAYCKDSSRKSQNKGVASEANPRSCSTPKDRSSQTNSRSSSFRLVTMSCRNDSAAALRRRQIASPAPPRNLISPIHSLTHSTKAAIPGCSPNIPSRNPSLSESMNSASSLSKVYGTMRYNSLDCVDNGRSSMPSKDQTGCSNTVQKPLSARTVAEKLVKALTKERFRSQSSRKSNSSKGELSKKVFGAPDEGRLSTPSISNEAPVVSYETSAHLLDRSSLNGSPRVPESPEDSVVSPNSSARFSLASHLHRPSVETMPSFRLNCKEKDSLVMSWLHSDCAKNEMLRSALEARASAREEQVALLEKEEEKPEYHVESGSANRKAVKVLHREIQKLHCEKRDLFREVALEIRARLLDQEVADEELRRLKSELEWQMKSTEKEKAEIQESFKRREAELIAKLDKMRVDEKRVSDEEFCQHTAEVQKKHRITAEGMAELKQALADSCRRERLAEEERDALLRCYKDKERENMELQAIAARLRWVRKDEEKTVQGLRQALDETANGSSEGKSENIIKLQRELLRLTGVEQALQSEVEALRREVFGLNKENRNLLERFKLVQRLGGTFDMIRLDQELRARMDALQVQSLKLQEENKSLSLKLRDMISHEGMDKDKALKPVHPEENGQHQLRQRESRIGNFRTSTQAMQGFLLREKIGLVNGHANADHESESYHPRSPSIQEMELQQEASLCNGLREKLHSREVELEQLEGSLITAIHSRDWLRMEVDSFRTVLTSSNRKVRELEQQLMEKEEEMWDVQMDAKQKGKELARLQDELPKVRSERDHIHREAEEMSKEVLKLTVEVETLKKRVEKLDEDVMLKDGQISILQGAFHD